MCDKPGVCMEHGLDYEYIVSTSNVLLFGINFKCVQKFEFEFISISIVIMWCVIKVIHEWWLKLATTIIVDSYWNRETNSNLVWIAAVV